MRDLNIELCFRERITADVYLFDVLARRDFELYPAMIGRVTVNVETKESIIHMNVGTDLSWDYKRIPESAIASAQNMKKLIEG